MARGKQVLVIIGPGFLGHLFLHVIWFFMGVIHPITAQGVGSYDRELLEVTAQVLMHSAVAIDDEIGPLLKGNDDLSRFIEDFISIILIKDSEGLTLYADNERKLKSMIAELGLPETVSRLRIGLAKKSGDFSVVKVKLMAQDEVLIVRLALNSVRNTIVSIERVS